MGETLNFRSLVSNGVTVAESTNEIQIGPATEVRLTAPDQSVWKLKVDNAGSLSTEQVV